MLEGAKLAVMPLGSPLADKLTAALNVLFGVLVTLMVPWAPAATLREAAETARAKLGAGRTVSLLVAVLEIPPPVAVMVMV